MTKGQWGHRFGSAEIQEEGLDTTFRDTTAWIVIDVLATICFGNAALEYDLTTSSFFDEGGSHASYTLKPDQSVFVGSKEAINLPSDLAARVLLRNSRIRQGLSLEAPLYFPGHSTVVYFRITNVSGSIIQLSTSKGIAQVTFERLEQPATSPYAGAFSDEFDYRGLADYSSAYEKDMQRLEEKADEVVRIVYKPAEKGSHP